MLAGQVAQQLGLSVKALRYYEHVGIITPTRLPNGYRDYDVHDMEAIRHVRQLTALGLTVEATRPFIECLQRGHDEGDDCVETLVAYQREIDRIDALLSQLTSNRALLHRRLHDAASRGFPTHRTREETIVTSTPSYEILPSNLPQPVDDGLADHLLGARVPYLAFRATDGSEVSLAPGTPGRRVLFVYPTTGVPGEDMPRGWDDIPGARGCTPEACGFRDNLESLRDAGAAEIYGLSTQDTAYQLELARRLHLPYPLLSDPDLLFRRELGLPVFEVEGKTFYKRMTLVLSADTIEHVFYPVFPPDEHAADVVAWLLAHPPIHGDLLGAAAAKASPHGN